MDFTIRWWVDAVHVSLSRVASDVGPWCQWENGLWTWSIRKISARFSREGWGIGGLPLGSATDSVCTVSSVRQGKRVSLFDSFFSSTFFKLVFL